MATKYVAVGVKENKFVAYGAEGEQRFVRSLTRAELGGLATRVLGAGTYGALERDELEARLYATVDGTTVTDEPDEDNQFGGRIPKVPKVSVETSDTSADKVLADLRKVLGGGGEVDYDKVREFIAREVAEHIAKPIEIVLRDKPNVTLTGLVHEAFPRVLAWVSSGTPIFLTGGAGVGKTTLADTIAQAIGARKIVVLQADAMPQKHEIFGFLSPVTGEFITGCVYDVFKFGGIFLVDEFDTGHTSLGTSLNLLLANGYYDFVNGERVTAHPDFRVIVTGNTYGQGGSPEFAGTNKVNGATLDRFVKYEVVVDEKLERSIVTGIDATIGKLVHDIVKKIRANGYRHNLRVFVTPRASIHITRGVLAGLTVSEAVTDKLLTGLPSDQQLKLLEGVSL